MFTQIVIPPERPGLLIHLALMFPTSSCYARPFLLLYRDYNRDEINPGPIMVTATLLFTKASAISHWPRSYTVAPHCPVPFSHKHLNLLRLWLPRASCWNGYSYSPCEKKLKLLHHRACSSSLPPSCEMCKKVVSCGHLCSSRERSSVNTKVQHPLDSLRANGL